MEQVKVVNPADGSTVGHFTDATSSAVSEACDAAAASQREWAVRSPRDRSDVLLRCRELMLRSGDELAELIVAENGKAMSDARGEVVYAAEFFRWYAEECVRLDGSWSTSPSGANHIIVEHPPVGVVGVVTPWNFPAAMLTRKVAPALAAGNSVVVKPSEETPLTALRLVELMREAGVPDGLVGITPTMHPGRWLDVVAEHGAVRMLSFTGSTQVGRVILRQAADRVLKVAMELGGNAPFVVLDDANVDDAVAGAMVAKMRHSAQTCTAADRFYVHASVHDEFAEKLAAAMADVTVGNGSDPAVTCGPLINRRAVDRIAGMVDEAIDRGATMITGTRPSADGCFHPPTVLTDVDDDASIITSEIFGPVAPIVRFDDVDDMLSRANDTEAGLAAYVFAGETGRGLRVARRIEAGMVAINQGALSDAAAPFGGMKQSGLGREGGAEGLREFCETRYLAARW